MKKAGIVVATIFSVLCWITSALVLVVSTFVLNAPASFDSIPQEQLTDDFSQELDFLTETIEEASSDLWREVRHGAIGFITSLIVFVTVLIKFPRKKFLFPSIAAGSAFVGAVFCGWMIMALMIGALIGIGLIMLSHYRESPK